MTNYFNLDFYESYFVNVNVNDSNYMENYNACQNLYEDTVDFENTCKALHIKDRADMENYVNVVEQALIKLDQMLAEKNIDVYQPGPMDDFFCGYIPHQGPNKGIKCLKAKTKNGFYCSAHNYCGTSTDPSKRICLRCRIKKPVSSYEENERYCKDCNCIIEMIQLRDRYSMMKKNCNTCLEDKTYMEYYMMSNRCNNCIQTYDF